MMKTCQSINFNAKTIRQKLLRNAYPYDLNEKTKSIGNIRKLFPLLPYYMENVLLKREQIKNQLHILYLSIYTNFLINLAVMNVAIAWNIKKKKKKELRTSGNLKQNIISQCSDFDREWYDLVIDSVFN